MTRKAVDRLAVVQLVVNQQLRQKEAARRLDLSVRQVRRLVVCLRAEGASGLVSRRLGRRPGNARTEADRHKILSLVRHHDADFGPTLACEKLAAGHGHRLSVETLRHWMIADGLWEPQRRRQARIHPRRPRRPCRGEWVQIDGSPHDGFEGRGPDCTLIVFIDDATSEGMALHFAPAETTQAYRETLRIYLAQHGRPVALYSDQRSIFRMNQTHREGGPTPFTRALRTLDIEPIHAHTPQAKGRVERANQTLQDRLVKELCLAGISTLETANTFLPDFIRAYNPRFAVLPHNPIDAHRPVQHGPRELDLILSLQETRKLSKNLTLQYQNREYQLTGQGQGYRLRGALITVSETFDGSVTLLHQGQILPYRRLSQGAPPIPLDDEKSVQATVDQAKTAQLARPTFKPAPDHPWKRRSYFIPQNHP
jgi:transposase